MGKFNLKQLLGLDAGTLIEKVSTGLDDLITNEEERAEAKRAIAEVLLNHEASLDSEVTERLRIDMTSDSWLSKNIRPLTLGAVFLIVSLITLFDGNIGSFHIQTGYLPLWESAFLTILVAYFGSRGAEKIFKDINTSKMKKNG